MNFPKFREDTRPPREAPPPGSCDCQVHIFGDPVRYPLRAGSAYAPPSDSTIEAADRMHRKLGLDRGVVVQATAHGTNHNIIVDALRGRPNYRGVAIVDNTVSDKDLERLHEAGCRAARFNFWKVLNLAPTPEEFERSVERIKGLGWHVKIHAVGQEWFDIQDLIKKVNIPLVIDHMGHPHAHDGLDHPVFTLLCELLRRENWWVTLSNGDRSSDYDAPWDDIVPFGRKLVEIAGDRAIWCSDWPHVRYEKTVMANDGDLLELLYRFAPDPVVRKRILVDNPKTLFGFEDCDKGH